MSLVKNWIILRLSQGLSITEVANDLADKTGKVVTISRLREWEDGRRGVPVDIHNMMLEDVLFDVLSQQPDHCERLYRKIKLP